jgi:hypothetical protein
VCVSLRTAALSSSSDQPQGCQNQKGRAKSPPFLFGA